MSSVVSFVLLELYMDASSESVNSASSSDASSTPPVLPSSASPTLDVSDLHTQDKLARAGGFRL